MGQRDTFMRDHQLRFISTLASRTDWFARLKVTPGILDVSYKSVIYCPSVVYGVPAPGVAIPLNAGEAGDFVRIAFSSAIGTYDDALYVVSNMGLQLADPCYEQAQLYPQGKPRPSWHSMGQEQAFAMTQTLIVQTIKRVTSSLWQQQLHALSGAVSIQTPYASKC